MDWGRFGEGGDLGPRRGRGGYEKIKRIKFIPLTILWVVYKERNMRVFYEVERDMSKIKNR